MSPEVSKLMVPQRRLAVKYPLSPDIPWLVREMEATPEGWLMPIGCCPDGRHLVKVKGQVLKCTCKARRICKHRLAVLVRLGVYLACDMCLYPIETLWHRSLLATLHYHVDDDEVSMLLCPAHRSEIVDVLTRCGITDWWLTSDAVF